MTIDPYFRREQSGAKYSTLQSYLAAVARKVGHFRRRITINYVDAFAGPWESKTDDLSDTSPYLAVEQLTRVSAELASAGKSLTVRAFFVTDDESGERQLAQLRGRFPAATIEIARGTFEDNIDAACRFVKQGDNPYSFVFLDLRVGPAWRCGTSSLCSARRGEKCWSTSCSNTLDDSWGTRSTRDTPLASLGR